MGLFDRKRTKKQKKKKKKPESELDITEQQKGNGKFDAAVQSHRDVVKDFLDEFDVNPDDLCITQECSASLDNEEEENA